MCNSLNVLKSDNNHSFRDKSWSRIMALIKKLCSFYGSSLMNQSRVIQPKRSVLKLTTSRLFVFDQSGSSFASSFVHRTEEELKHHSRQTISRWDWWIINCLALCNLQTILIYHVYWLREVSVLFISQVFFIFCTWLQPGTAPLKVWRMVNSP